VDVARPHGLISHRLDSAVLHVLAGTNTGLTGRRVAALANEGTQQGIAKALSRLSDEGIVEREEVGNAMVFRLNREHLAAAPIEQLMHLREAFVRRVAEEFLSWQIRPVHASMFGSAARGDGDVNSDIDLFVVRPDGIDAEDPGWRGQVERLAAKVEAWTGNRASVADFSENDVADLRERRPAIVSELEVDAIRLVGPEVAAVLRETG
jgi:predicted nucleotidyltransferase